MVFNRLTLTAHFCAALLLLNACSEKSPEPLKTADAAPAAISTTAQKYEGKIVRQPPADRGKDDGWYLVKDGKRRWITDSSWLEKNGYQATSVIEITSTEFSTIPEDPIPVN